MRPFEISRYMKKYTLPIVVFSFAAGTILYLLVTFIFQSFIANTVIRYPEGTKADTSEIYASNIVSAAMDDLGIDKNQVDTDYIRNNIKVTPIVSEDETMLKEAVLNNGEAYTNEPSAYLVTYTSDVTEGKEFARIWPVLGEYEPSTSGMLFLYPVVLEFGICSHEDTSLPHIVYLDFWKCGQCPTLFESTASP